jgi:hypothetical protein
VTDETDTFGSDPHRKEARGAVEEGGDSQVRRLVARHGLDADDYKRK